VTPLFPLCLLNCWIYHWYLCFLLGSGMAPTDWQHILCWRLLTWWHSDPVHQRPRSSCCQAPGSSESDPVSSFSLCKHCSSPGATPWSHSCFLGHHFLGGWPWATLLKLTALLSLSSPLATLGFFLPVPIWAYHGIHSFIMPSLSLPSGGQAPVPGTSELLHSVWHTVGAHKILFEPMKLTLSFFSNAFNFILLSSQHLWSTEHQALLGGQADVCWWPPSQPDSHWVVKLLSVRIQAHRTLWRLGKGWRSKMECFQSICEECLHAGVRDGGVPMPH
jgi:hypothetical protein